MSKKIKLSDKQKEVILNEMNRYFHTDNLQEKRKSAIKKGTAIQFDFNLVFANDPSYFSAFLKRLSVQETEIFTYFHTNILESTKVENFGQFSLLKSQFQGIDLDNSKLDNLEIIRKSLHVETVEEVEEFLNERNINYDVVFANQMKTTATNLLDGLFEIWLKRFDFDKFSDFEAKGLTRKAFNDLKESMFSTIDSMGIREQILTIIQNRTKNIHCGKSTEDYLSAICESYINDFVTNFGFSLVSSEKLHELELISEEFNFHSQGVLKSDSVEVDDKILAQVFDGLSATPGNTNVLEDMRPMIDNYGNFVTKIKLALLANCGFVNYDIEANAKLGELLKELDSLNFNIT
jgi:hypothetical protein